MPTGSSRSAGATYLDRAARIEQLRAAAIRARTRLPGIERVLLFGSLSNGLPTPRSDADLLVIIRTAAASANSVPTVLAALAPLPCPVDLFVLTAAEFDTAREERHPLVREALAHGLDLL